MVMHSNGDPDVFSANPLANADPTWELNALDCWS